MGSMLNYNFLFQDVDIIWYKNPLDFFHNNSSNNSLRNFDILLSRDGNNQLRFSPFYANSGFYYVRSNDKTRYLFTTFVYAGDLLMRHEGHQAVLTQLLTEHSSLFGLKVKILHGEEFPGGREYHEDRPFMLNLIKKGAKKVPPWIFHMSWTLNKDYKILFLKQMGMWYVKEQFIIHQP